MGRMFRFAGLYALLTRELCQSVCSSATCLIPRPSRIYASICRASEPQPRLCCPPIGRPVDREASRLSTTRTARSPKKRSGGSTSNRSKAGRWPSAKRGPGKTGRPGLGLVVSAARVPAVRLRGSAVPGQAASRRDRPRAAAWEAHAAGTSVRMRHQRTSASRTERTPTAVRKARSRSARSDASTTPTRTGAPKTMSRTSRSTISPPARRRMTTRRRQFRHEREEG